jgi:hypothetical protein
MSYAPVLEHAIAAAKSAPYLLISLLLAAMPASAELYKWVGPDGKAHYGDAPPPGDSAARALNIPKDPAPVLVSSPEAELRKAELKQQKDKRQAERNMVLQEQQRTERIKERCDRALLQYQRAINSPAVVANGPDSRWNNFAERNERIISAKLAAQAACQGVYTGF